VGLESSNLFGVIGDALGLGPILVASMILLWRFAPGAKDAEFEASNEVTSS
jgi:hypothetical protein